MGELAPKVTERARPLKEAMPLPSTTPPVKMCLERSAERDKREI